MFGPRSQVSAFTLLFGGTMLLSSILACSGNSVENETMASATSTGTSPTASAAPQMPSAPAAVPSVSAPSPSTVATASSATSPNGSAPSITPTAPSNTAPESMPSVPNNSAGGSAGQTGGAGGSSAGGTGGTAPSNTNEPGGAGGLGGATLGDGGSAGAAVAGSGGSAGAGGAANPPLIDRDEALSLMRLVANYYLANFGMNYDKSWLRSTFYTGLMAAYRTTQDEVYFDAAKTWGAADGYAQPNVNSVDSNGEPRHADNQTCFQTYAELYELDPAPTEAMLATAIDVFDTMVESPRTGRSEWSWCDSLYMAPPALVRVGVLTDEPAYISLMNDMFWDTTEYLFEPDAGFFWRDNARRNTAFWSRGNGWVFAGIARILEYLPATDERRGDYEALLLEMATALASAQNQEDGLWRSDLLNPDAYPNPESSGTAFFCFGLAWGIHHGVLDRATFEPVVLRAWRGLVDVALTEDGLVGWVQGPAHMPGAAERMGTNDYAAGAFLLAASEMVEL